MEIGSLAVKLVISLFSQILNIFVVIFDKFKWLCSKVVNRKPPFDSEKSKQIAFTILGGMIHDAISFKNVFSRKRYIATIQSSQKTANIMRLVILGETGNSYSEIWSTTEVFHPSQFKVVDIDKDGKYEISYVQSSFGASGINGMKTLNVYRLRDGVLYRIGESFDYLSSTGQKAPTIYREEYNDKKFNNAFELHAVSEGFLKKIDIEFTNPKFAIAHWHFLNGDANFGEIKLYLYPGPPPELENSISVRLNTDLIDWIGYFKGALVGFLKNKNKHFIAFSSPDEYNWVKQLVLFNDRVFFITHSEDGFFSFKLKSDNFAELRKFDFYKSNKLPRAEKLSIKGNVLVLNDNLKIDINDIIASL